MATQAQVDAAELAMNNARSIRDGASASAQGYYNALGKCVSGKGNGKPLSSDNLPDFLEKGTADSCVDECWKCSCKDGGCCSKKSCRNKVNDYNDNWIYDVECRIMQKTLIANTFHHMRRSRKMVR